MRGKTCPIMQQWYSHPSAYFFSFSSATVLPLNFNWFCQPRPLFYNVTTFYCGCRSIQLIFLFELNLWQHHYWRPILLSSLVHVMVFFITQGWKDIFVNLETFFLSMEDAFPLTYDTNNAVFLLYQRWKEQTSLHCLSCVFNLQRFVPEMMC